jgi:ribose transport system substrate-binding protein
MRSTRRRTKLFAILAVLALAVTACGNGDTTEPDDTTDADAATEETEATEATEAGDDTEEGDEVSDASDVTIGLALSTLQNPFFVTLRDGAQTAADEAGATLSVSDAQDDAQQQADDIQDFITQAVDVILINPVDSAAIVPSIEAANEAGIPVFTVDRGAEGGEVVTHIASDNVLGGRLAAEYLFGAIGEGMVVQLEGVPGASATNDRGAGFQEALDGATGIELASSQTANFNREEGYNVAQNLFQATPDLAGLFAQNDEMALGAVEAAEEAGLSDLVIVGFDATDDALAAIADGRLAGTVAQQPARMGELGVNLAVDFLVEGEELTPTVPVEVTVVTADNVDEFLPEG